MQPSLNPTTSIQDHSKLVRIVGLIKRVRISQIECMLVFHGPRAAAVRIAGHSNTKLALFGPKLAFTQMSKISAKKTFFFAVKKTFFRRVKTFFQKWVTQWWYRYILPGANPWIRFGTAMIAIQHVAIWSIMHYCLVSMARKPFLSHCQSKHSPPFVRQDQELRAQWFWMILISLWCLWPIMIPVAWILGMIAIEKTFGH